MYNGLQYIVIKWQQTTQYTIQIKLEEYKHQELDLDKQGRIQRWVWREPLLPPLDPWSPAPL